MKFWQKNTEDSPVLQALVQQLENKDAQIAELMERQRETNILLKNDQEQLLQLREASIPTPVVNADEHRDQMFEQVKLRATANRSSFLNWLLILSILVLSYGFMYWVNIMSAAATKSEEVVKEMNFELNKANTRMTLLMRDIEDGKREIERMSLEAAVLKEDALKKEQELTYQLLKKDKRIEELEKLNSTLTDQKMKQVPPPLNRRR